MDCMEDCRDVALTVLPNIFPIDMKEHCIEGSSFMNHFAKSFRQNFAFEAYKVESVPDWIFSNICTKWLVIFFHSFPLPKLINYKPRRNRPISQSQVLFLFFFAHQFQQPNLKQQILIFYELTIPNIR